VRLGWSSVGAAARTLLQPARVRATSATQQSAEFVLHLYEKYNNSSGYSM